MDSSVFMLSKAELKSLIQEAVSKALESHDRRNENKQTFLNIQEAAALLNLAVNTVYEKTSNRTIPFYKHGKKIMFKKSELLAWVESRKIQTVRELREQATARTVKKCE